MQSISRVFVLRDQFASSRPGQPITGRRTDAAILTRVAGVGEYQIAGHRRDPRKRVRPKITRGTVDGDVAPDRCDCAQVALASEDGASGDRDDADACRQVEKRTALNNQITADQF